MYVDGPINFCIVKESTYINYYACKDIRGVFGKFRDKCRNFFIYNNFSIIPLAHNSNGYILFVQCNKLTLVPTKLDILSP